MTPKTKKKETKSSKQIAVLLRLDPEIHSQFSKEAEENDRSIQKQIIHFIKQNMKK